MPKISIAVNKYNTSKPRLTFKAQQSVKTRSRIYKFCILPIGYVATFGMGLRTAAIISVQKNKFDLSQASYSKVSVYLNYIFHVPMNYTSNWNKLDGDKIPYIHNLTTLLRLVKMSLEMSPVKFITYDFHR